MAATFKGLRVTGTIRLNTSSVPTPTDQYPQYTVLRLPGTGTNNTNNNVFLDSSSNNFTITRFGNTTQGSFSPFSTAPGYWSNYFDGSGDYLSIPTQTISSSQSFCLEAWVFVGLSSGPQVQTIIGGPDDNFGDQRNVQFRIDGSNFPSLYFGGSSAGASVAIPVNTWTHVAAVRNNNSIRIYVNGVGGTASAGSTSGQIRHIGALGRGGGIAKPFTGYISNVRITVGSPVYTANFTPSTTPLTAITGTLLLTCQSNRFVDNSTNNFTITRNGDTSVSAFGPFAPASSYNAATMGGSMYFDGTGDYLNTAASSALTLGTGDLTLECYIYQTATSTSTYRVIFGDNVYGSAGGYTLYSYNNALNLWKGSAGGGTEVIAPAGTITLNTWTHVAWTRSGSSNRLFINGTQVGATTTDSTNYTSTTSYIGASVAGTFGFAGYISNARIIKGTAVYTANFTPPTAPVAAITGTSVLLNAINGAIVDQSTKNNIETVGDAKISTAISANGSMYFDGTGDYLTIPANINLAFGTGDFTAEFWIYKSASGTAAILDYASTGGFGINITDTQIIPFISASTGFASNSVVPLNTWTHVAVARQGTTLRTFMNGNLVGTATTSANFTSPSTLNIGRNPTVNSQYLNGYINDLRLTNGIARYTANFTPPTRS